MYECYFTVSGSSACIFVLELFVLRHSSFVMLQSIYVIVLFILFSCLICFLSILCVLSSVFFLLMYISVLAFCIQV